MSNPLALLPYALAAGGASVDGVPAASLVAAGFTLLRRSAPLVRGLGARRSALLLPPSRAVLTALAASDGRGALLLPQDATADELTAWIALADVGVVFTTRALAPRVRADRCAVVELDDLPRTATVVAGGERAVVDLGSHFSLALEGEEDPGRDEECLISVARRAAPMRGAVFSHRHLLSLARGAVDAVSLIKGDHVLAAMPVDQLAPWALTYAAPLLAGARVTTLVPFAAEDAVRIVEHDEVTLLVGSSEMFAAMAGVLAARGTGLNAPALRVCAFVADRADAALQERWHELAGHELRLAIGSAGAPLSLFSAPHFPNRRGAYGIPFPGVQASVRDAAHGIEVGRGAAGELWVRGGPVSFASLPAGVASAVVRDGWLNTRLAVRERPDGAFEPA